MNTPLRALPALLLAILLPLLLPASAAGQAFDPVARSLAQNPGRVIGLRGGYEGLVATRTVSLPTSMASAMAGINLGGVTLYEDPERTVAKLGRSVQAIFGDFSSAVSAPGATFYVDGSIGNDANNCTASGTPCLSISGAVTKANTAGVASKIYVKVLTGANACYNRALGPVSTSQNVLPTVDVAFMAYGIAGGPGVVVICAIDAGFSTAADATYPNTYSTSVSNVDQIVDIAASPDRFGHYPRLQQVATAAIANRTPNAFACSGNTSVNAGSGTFASCGTVYINRADGQQPTLSNTRLYRPVPGFLITSNINVYIGSSDGTGWAIEGGAGASPGGVGVQPSALGSTKHIVAMEGVTTRYGFRGFSADGWHGYVLCNNCGSGATDEDGFNVHNDLFSSAAQTVFIGVNFSAYDNGGKTHTSNQCFTGHDSNLWGVMVGGVCESAAGGALRFIGNSVLVAAGVTVRNDRGDQWTGGALPATLVRLDDTANAYLDGVRLQGPAGIAGLDAIVSTGTIYLRNMQPSTLRTTGTIGSW